ncbi:MAG: Nif3-like dinuclear metal center hexameric protein [Oscillospiraceae bacterium]|nr:Nif3-like dinuclear metal center hexameric protein [Oscillospiraceae bacterium]
MTNVNDVYGFLKEIAPLEMAMESDNVGFLVGTSTSDVTNILVSLDITDEVITEAIDNNVELIVAHHPMFFSLNTVTDTDLTGNKIVRLLTNGISAICMHTNLDAARGGVNDALAVAVGIADNDRQADPLSDAVRLDNGEIVSLGRLGYLKEVCTMDEYLAVLKRTLHADGFKYYDAGRDVHKVAIASGSGSSQWSNAIRSGCDTFVSADLKYHLFLEAKELGINVIDGGHFSTENVVVDVLNDKISLAFPDVNVMTSGVLDQIFKFF